MIDEGILGDLSAFLTGTGMAPLPKTPKLDVLLVPTLPILPGQLLPEDVVPPGISFEDY